MDALCQIVCGTSRGHGEAFDVLSHIRRSMSAFGTKAESLLNVQGDSDLTLIGPYCARVLMETGCAAIVGRLDPFRILYLSRFQSHAGYDPTKRSKSAFGWQGDVITPEKDRDDLWSDNLEVQRISRALFSVHTDHIHWRPAVLAALDYAASLERNPIVTSFLATDAADFVREVKGRGSMLYSHLSKGVHCEFFTNMALVFDDQTVRQSIREAIAWLSRIALISHFIPTAQHCLDWQDAFSAYSVVMEQINA